MEPAPPKGSWFRIIPHGPSAGRYHRLRAVARLQSSDGEELEIMESVCRQAFTVDRVIDVVGPRDPVLRRYVEANMRVAESAWPDDARVRTEKPPSSRKRAGRVIVAGRASGTSVSTLAESHRAVLPGLRYAVPSLLDYSGGDSHGDSQWRYKRRF